MPANGNKLIVLGDINAFHYDRRAENLCFRGQLKVVFQHHVESARLFRFAVCVHQRFFDKLIKARLAQVKSLFRGVVFPFSLCAHADALFALSTLPPKSDAGLGFNCKLYAIPNQSRLATSTLPLCPVRPLPLHSQLLFYES
jgi:hypothetical protein